jgi:hypothetical protein
MKEIKRAGRRELGSSLRGGESGALETRRIGPVYLLMFTLGQKDKYRACDYPPGFLRLFSPLPCNP